MNSRAPFEDLDWPKLLELASAEARTPYGKSRILALVEVDAFAQTPARAREVQAETAEMVQILERSALWGPLSGLEEVDDLLGMGLAELQLLLEIEHQDRDETVVREAFTGLHRDDEGNRACGLMHG